MQIAKKEKLRKIVQNKGTFCGLIKKSGVMPFENIKLKLLMTFLLSTILSWYQADIKAINSSRLILIFAEHKKSCNFLWCSPLSTCCLLLPFTTESPYSNWHYFLLEHRNAQKMQPERGYKSYLKQYKNKFGLIASNRFSVFVHIV